ncbi:AMP-binding protein, partial [Arthrospira platensis SPKY1]|nr:AMP-binding protein [Arthrospira platensis SPKY1]
FCPGYGLAEATLGVSVLSANEPVQIVHKDGASEPMYLDGANLDIAQPEQYWVSNGHVAAGADVKIVDAKTGLPVPDGQEGEIWVHHPGFVAQGYWNHETDSQA